MAQFNSLAMEGESGSDSPIEVAENMTCEATVKTEAKPVTLWNFHGCKLCPYKTKSYFIMKSHLRRHRVTRNSKLFHCNTSIVERYKCSSCDFKTSILVNFNKHVEVSHRRALEVKVDNGGNQDEESSFFVFGNFNIINNTTFLKCYICESCNFKSYSQLAYIKHYTGCPLNDRINGNSAFRHHNPHKEFLRWHKYHNRPNYLQASWFQCTKCPFKAKRQSSLDGHIKTQHLAPKYRFFKKVKPKRPLRVIKLHLCDDCNFTTTKIVALRNHILSKHTPYKEIQWFKCNECPYRAKWRQNLYSHIQNNHSAKRFFCEHCPFASKQKRFVEAHIMVNHPDSTWKKAQIIAKKNTQFACSDCSFVTETKIAVINHMYYKHGQRQNKDVKECKQCNYWAVSEAKMKRHKERCHQAVKLFECDQCEFKSTKSRDLRGHMDKHGVQSQTLRCEVCIFKSSHVTELQKHILEVHVEKETVVCFKCQLCTFKTIEEGELKEHVFKKHIDPQNTNWFHCEMCSFKYRQQSELKAHILEKHIL